MLEKELMIRLRIDGEIVGFMWLKDGDVYGYRGKTQPFSFTAWIAWGPTTRIPYDTFDMGIKIDDEWFFDEEKENGQYLLDGQVHEGIPG